MSSRPQSALVLLQLGKSMCSYCTCHAPAELSDAVEAGLPDCLRSSNVPLMVDSLMEVFGEEDGAPPPWCADCLQVVGRGWGGCAVWMCVLGVCVWGGGIKGVANSYHMFLHLLLPTSSPRANSCTLCVSCARAFLCAHHPMGINHPSLSPLRPPALPYCAGQQP